jgi:fructokinase
MILCCGEALIDMVPGLSAQGEACFLPKAGGAVFNTAIALARLGSDTSLYTGVSDDLFGTLLTHEL